MPVTAHESYIRASLASIRAELQSSEECTATSEPTFWMTSNEVLTNVHDHELMSCQ